MSKQETKEMKIVAVGDGAVGKTSLLTVLNGKEFPDRYVPTVIDNYTQTETLDNTIWKFHIWDTAGQDDYDRIRPLAYPNTKVVLLCFALDTQLTFVNLTERWLIEVKHYNPNAKIIVVGIKSDLREEGNPNHVTDEAAQEFVTKNGLYSYIPCSAKTKDGLEKIFPECVKAANIKSKKSCNLI